MAIWNKLFAYKAGTNSIGDMIHYTIARVAFSWNADNQQKAIFQHLLDTVHDERLALSYTYSRINHDESFNRVDDEVIRGVETHASSDESIWHCTNNKLIDLYKQEFLEEDKRWAMQGLTQTEINKRRISKEHIDRQIAVSTQVLHRIPLFDETDIVVYDKIYGFYTIELQGPYWAPWERPIFRWYYKGDEAQILKNVKWMPEYKTFEQLHKQYVMKQREIYVSKLRQDEFLKETEQARRELQAFREFREEQELLQRIEQQSKRPRVISCRKRQEQLDHVRAAMGGQSSVDNDLLDNSIF